MSTFNVGDEVKCICSDEPGLIVGEIYTVIEVIKETPTNNEFIRVDGKWENDIDMSEFLRDPHLFDYPEECTQSTDFLTPLLLALGAGLLKHLIKG